MRNGPRLSVTCGRCGQPRRGIRHDCIVSSGRASRRRATPKLKLDFGKCPDCRKTVGNPLTHVCAPKSDFKKRKRAAEKREREAARARAKKRQPDKHDYLACKDEDCKRSLCVAHKAGWREGHKAGFEDGWAAGYGTGYAEGFTAGRESCPGPHGGG